MADSLPASRDAEPLPAGPALLRFAFQLLSAISPNAAARWMADLFMKPRRFRRPDRERTAIATARPFEITVGPSQRVRGWSWGEGPLVFLVHGWEGRGAQLSAFVFPLAAAGFRVVAWDAPGHGESDGKRSSLVHFTWALRQMAEALGNPHAVIAHSLGCAATTLALREGLSVERLVYVAPPLEPGDYPERFGEVLGARPDVVARMKLHIEDRFLRKWSDYSLASTAKTMTTPLLIVHDADDRDTFLYESTALAKAWPGSRLIATKGLGHRRILRDPSILAMATEFISGSSPVAKAGFADASER